jgi:aspartate kinase
MALIVQKFGGTSVGSIERIKHVATLVAKEKEKGNDVIVVVSAMSGVTSQMVDYANQVSPLLNEEALAEYDCVISSGEQITSGLLALQLQSLGFKSRSFLGWQVGIKTDKTHSKSKISDIDKKVFNKHLEEGFIPVVAGFQGVTDCNRISTMGRGGSDTSAVAIAAALKAERCDIYTDVKGVFSADPRIVPKARKYDKIGYNEAIEMTSLGAKVLQTRSVEMAIKHGVTVQVLSSFENEPGTLLVKDEEIMEKKLVTAVAHSKYEARVTLKNVNNTPGVVARIFKPLGAAGINLDIIIQNISYNGSQANVTFTVNEADLDRAVTVLNDEKEKGTFAAEEIIGTKDVAKVSIIGIGMQDSSGVAQKMFETMAENNINILAITTSEIKVSILI